jgi:S1-C subfamily serine protease
MAKRLFVYTLLVILIIFKGSSPLLADSPPSQPIAAAKSVYKVLMANKETSQVFGSGTGFVAENKDGLLRIVTNSHVCADNDLEINPSIGFLTKNMLEDGRALKKEIFDPFTDICVLSFLVPEQGVNEVPLKMSESPTKEGDPIIVLGHPLGGPLKATIGTRINVAVIPVGLMDTDFVLVNEQGSQCFVLPMMEDKCLYFRTSDTYRVEIKPGNSGSPVLNSQGQVTGIIWGTYGIEANLALAANWLQLGRYIK